jgi:hypothetical protein
MGPFEAPADGTIERLVPRRRARQKARQDTLAILEIHVFFLLRCMGIFSPVQAYAKNVRTFIEDLKSNIMVQ